jgi:hypothetical protein
MAKQTRKGVSYDEWRRAFRLAEEIRVIEPWEFMEETDIFGVEDPVSGTMGFVSVMGMLGELFAVALYEGATALYDFFAAQDANLNAYPERVLEAQQLQLSFENRDMLDRRDRELIKRMGLQLRGPQGWPMFRSYRAGFVPSLIDQDELRFLSIALEQCLDVFPRFEADPSLLDESEDMTFLVRVPKRRGDQIIPIVEYDDLFEECRGLKKSDEAFELDFFWLATPIQEGPRPFYPYVLLLVGVDSGKVLGLRMLHVEDSFEAMWGKLPRSLLEIFLDIRRVPHTVHVRSSRLAFLIEPLSEQVPFTITPADELPVLDDAKESLYNHMESR